MPLREQIYPEMYRRAVDYNMTASEQDQVDLDAPIVLFESMASGTPFLTLACGNAAEIVEWSRGGGMLAPTIEKEEGFVDGDPTTFAALIDELLANPTRLRAMGDAGRTAWAKDFTWEKIAAQYEALYQSMLLPSESGSPRRP